MVVTWSYAVTPSPASAASVSDSSPPSEGFSPMRPAKRSAQRERPAKRRSRAPPASDSEHPNPAPPTRHEIRKHFVQTLDATHAY